MTIKQLGKILKEMYDNAPDEYKVANIHLFGVKYANIIQQNYYSATEIVRESGISVIILKLINKLRNNCGN